ncbi:cytochrome C5 [Microbacterium sp.]|uniref:cytochrome C5 n=1 Tax=Microbacterium sp. TaxID=51671 RepID=UPI00356897B3
MSSPLLDTLLARIVDSGLLDDPVAENGLVYGRATIDAAGAVVTVNVDPELEDDEETLDDDALIAAITRILSVSETRWRAVIDEVADNIDEAVDDEPVIEQVDLRDDLEATSVVVFADAVLIAFDAPKQFPDSRILVQLDDDLEVANIEVRDRDAADVEVLEFDDLDELLDRLSGDDR